MRNNPSMDVVEKDLEHGGSPLKPQSAATPRREKTALRVLWRDHLRIGLGSKWLALACYRRGLRSTPARKEIVAVEPADHSTPWRAAVDVLPEAIALAGLRRPEVTVVLSNHFVRYALLPWNATLRTEAEWLAFARHRFSSVHGPAAEQWAIRVSATDPQGPRIASAIDRALLAALAQEISGAASLVSVQPYLMAAFNRMRPLIGPASCWLVLEEPGRLTLALIQNGVWRTIRSRRKDEHWRLTLPEILERESALLAFEEPCMRVVVCTHVPFDTQMHGTYELCDLTLAPGATASDRELAMALA